jgi:hypothetical protein
MAVIVLPWPPASLSGHNNGHWRDKARIVATHRAWAFHATRAVKIKASDTGDIRIHVRFFAPDNRGDRTNYPNRLKPYFDGIAESLGVNDRRFLPSYEFMPNEPPGRIEVVLPDLQCPVKQNGPDDATNVNPALTINAKEPR